MKLQTGNPAPDFSLPDQNGKTVSLSDFKNKKAVVVYFYPKDETPGCTAEACAFRDDYEDFKDLGAEVIGISSDSQESHQKFIQKHNLPFILLSDKGGQVQKAYGVKKTFGLLPGRVTFIIDKAGILRHSFSSQVQVKKHVQEALKTLRSS